MFVMFTFVLAVKFAATLVSSMNPVTMLSMARHPEPLIPTIPVARHALVKTAITDIDIETDRIRGWLHHENSRHKDGQQQCTFLLHSGATSSPLADSGVG